MVSLAPLFGRQRRRSDIHTPTCARNKPFETMASTQLPKVWCHQSSPQACSQVRQSIDATSKRARPSAISPRQGSQQPLAPSAAWVPQGCRWHRFRRRSANHPQRCKPVGGNARQACACVRSMRQRPDEGAHCLAAVASRTFRASIDPRFDHRWRPSPRHTHAPWLDPDNFWAPSSGETARGMESSRGRASPSPRGTRP